MRAPTRSTDTSTATASAPTIDPPATGVRGTRASLRTGTTLVLVGVVAAASIRCHPRCHSVQYRRSTGLRCSPSGVSTGMAWTVVGASPTTSPL